AGDVILSANTPSVALYRLARWWRAHPTRFVPWGQDIYCLAAYPFLRRKFPVVGPAAGKDFILLVKWSFRHRDAVVVISEDFSDFLIDWGINRQHIHTIHNWAPIESLPVRPRENDWSRQQRLSEGLRFLYSGTLAMKHNPALLLELA